MKPMTLNMSKLKKVGGDKKSSTFMHDDGHKMVIAHGPLPALQRKQLEKMPIQKMAEGGDAEAPEQDAAPAPDQAAPADQQAAPTQQPVGPDFPGYFQQGQQAINQQKNIDIQKAQAEVPVQQKAIDDATDLNQTFQDNTQQLMDHQKAVMDDMSNPDHAINPRHYQENMGTGQKIASTIGLILGGMSTPFTHQGNPAMDMLNKQIDRDIDAQKARFGQQKTLLEANQHLFNDTTMAENQTRVNLNDIYGKQIQQEALKLGTPQAIQAANMAQAKFGMQNSALLNQNAMRKTVLDKMQNGGNGALTPIDLAHAGFMPEPQAIKEQASINAQNSGIQNLKNLYSQLAQEQTLARRSSEPWQSKAKIDALNAQITNAIVESDASKRLTPTSLEAEITPFHGGLIDTPNTIQQKMNGALNLQKQKTAGQTPITGQYSPKSLPNYEAAMIRQTAAPVERQDKVTGKIWLYDPLTKQPIGPKQ